MPLQATALLVLSAFTHAMWNLFAKRSQAPLLSLWWTLVGGSVVVLGYLTWDQSFELPPRESWGLLVVGGIAEAVYLYALTRAYACGDLSTAYPISRGSAPPLVALWAALLFGERLPLTGYLGIGLLVAGIALAAASGWKAGMRWSDILGEPSSRWALLSGLGISVYSIVDKLSLQYLPPQAYNFWAFVAMFVCLIPVLHLDRSGDSLGGTLRREWRTIAVGCVLVPGTSGLVMQALALAPASYVAALRGLSVLAGAMLARVFLSEQVGSARLTAAALLTAGTACLALAG